MSTASATSSTPHRRCSASAAARSPSRSTTASARVRCRSSGSRPPHRAQRRLSELLPGANGVGPKVALAILSGSTPAELRRAIARDDVKRFQAIPGVGLKTAQRVVLELKEKLTLVDNAAAEGGDLTARDALVELGWT